MKIKIDALFRYPVKSMGGHRLERSHADTNGFPGDRCWAVKDETRNTFGVGKRNASIMGMQAELQNEPTASQPSPPVVITFADGQQHTSSDAGIHSALSTALGTPVSLRPLVPKEQTDHYLRQENPDSNTDPETAMRELFARNSDEPLPDFSQFPKEIFTYESPPGTYFDAFPLLLMSRSALHSLQTHRAQSQFDLRRFRPNILVDGADGGFPEDLWAGKTARIGEATLKFEMACPRCVMTTHGFDNLTRDPGIMRAIVNANAGNLGIYATVIEPGCISTGDTLEFLN